MPCHRVARKLPSERISGGDGASPVEDRRHLVEQHVAYFGERLLGRARVGFPAASSSTGSGWLKQRWRISLNACWSIARRCVRVWPGRRLRSLSIMTVASLRRAASAVGGSSSMPANVASPPGAANGTQPLQANTFI